MLKYAATALLSSLTALSLSAGEDLTPVQSKDWFGSAEVLLWQPYEDDLDSVAKTDVTSGNVRSSPDRPLTQTPIESSTKCVHPGFDWATGFRLELGKKLTNCEDLIVSLRYTYYQNDDSRITKVPTLDFSPGATNRAFMDPLWFPSIMGSVIQSAKTKWQLDFHTLDLNFSKTYHVTSCLSFKPEASLRMALIKQDYSVVYDAFFEGIQFQPTSGNVEESAETSMKAKNDFIGGGLRIGFQLRWMLMKNFFFTLSGHGSLLVGNFEVDQRYNGQSPLSINAPMGMFGLTENNIRQKQDFHAIRPNIESRVGFEWRSKEEGEAGRISVGIFYHITHWWRQNELLRTNLNTDNFNLAFPSSVAPFQTSTITNRNSFIDKRSCKGDLGLHGASLRIAFDF